MLFRHFKYILPLLLLLFEYTSYAQPVHIRGRLFDRQQHLPVEGATITLCKSADSSFVKGGISAPDGIFMLTAYTAGSHFLHISCIGYRTIDFPLDLSATRDTLDIGHLWLTTTDIPLEEATVLGKQSGMRVDNDTVEYFPGAYRTMKNAVVEDLLKKLPGVEIDEDGKIMVNGQEIKQINIDGKEFFGNDPKIATQYLPVDLIDVLQIVEKKSDMEELTGIDDGNRQYVINIKVKQDRNRGLFGTLKAGAGTEDIYEASLLLNRFAGNTQLTALGGSNNMNNIGFSDMLKNIPSQIASQATQSARNGKGIVTTRMGGINYTDHLLKKSLKINGNVFFADFKREENRFVSRQNFLPAGFNRVTQNRRTSNHSPQLKTEWKLDYQLHPKFRIIFRPNVIWGKGERNTTGEDATFRGDTTILDSSYIDNGSKEKNYFLKSTLSFSYRPGKNGRNLTTEVSGQLSQTHTDAHSSTDKIKFKKGNPASGTHNPLNRQISDRTVGRDEYRIRFNYSEPITKTLQLNAVYQFKRSTTLTDKITWKWNSRKEEYVFLPSQTNRFENLFNNHRIELGVRKYWKKINLRIGGALEPTEMDSYSYKADTLFYTVSKNSLNISPYIHFICPFSKSKNLRIDVQSNTRQPSGTQLQPVKDESNPNHIREGNPDLKPIISTRIALRYNDYNKARQRTLVATLNTYMERNSITNRTEYIEEGVQYSQPVNINGIWNAGFTFTYNFPLSRTLRFSSFTSGNYNRGIGFLADKKKVGEKNVSDHSRLRERIRLTYRIKSLELGLRSTVQYNQTIYSLQANRNIHAFDITTGANTELYFPHDRGGIRIDYSYNFKTGYSEGFSPSQHLLNAQIDFSFFKNRQGTVSLKGYDLLQQRQILNRNARSNYIEDIRYNSLPRYVTLSFSYRFTRFAQVKR